MHEFIQYSSTNITKTPPGTSTRQRENLLFISNFHFNIQFNENLQIKSITL